jgi:hypothetical protein
VIAPSRFACALAALGLLAACASPAPTATTAPAKPTTAPAAVAATTAPAAASPAATTAAAATKPAAATTGVASPAASSPAAASTGAASPAAGSASPAATGAAAAATKPAASAASPAAGGTTTAASTSGTATSGTPAAGASPAAASGTATAGRVVQIDAADYSFAAPETIEGGLVTVRLKNGGQEAHHAQFARLKDTTTLDQFMAALQKGPDGALPLVALEGGPAALAPGGTAEVTLDLKAGQYVLLCFIPSRDGVPHLAKGMVKPVRVTAPAAAAAAPTPVAAGTIVMKDFTFDVPETVPTGRAVYRVNSTGPTQPHEAAIVKLNEGKTAQDYAAFFSAPPAGPPPGQNVGGMQGLDNGSGAWVTVDLPAGNYALICQIPDPASGKPHIALGMVKGFTVK